MTAKKTSLRPTKSYAAFETVAKRSLTLISLQSPAEKLLALRPTDDPIDLSDMSRAAVVLAVAAMDAYFTDVFAERFVPYLQRKQPTKAMVDLLSRAGLDTSCALHLLGMQRPYRRIRKLIEDFHEHTTTQRLHIIDQLFLAYGLKNFTHSVQNLKRRKTLLRSVELLVQRRHQIAHDGDLNAHRRLRPVNTSEIRKRIEDLLTFVSGSDELLQRQMCV